MIQDHLELYEMIRENLEKEFPSETTEQAIARDRLAGVATLGAINYLTELEEAVENLRASVPRLSKEG